MSQKFAILVCDNSLVSKCSLSLAQVGSRVGKKATQVLLSFQCLGLLMLGAISVGFWERSCR